ncbi:TPA: hypothetical protein O4F91_001727 [Vibrio alginolyticus]|uniref:hypothetical protein n=1 Tax=Vibrio TaxID=662 RepID=UPI0029644055|nr:MULTISPECIES: hypothetical protein [unclassified Vibrio]MDW1674184.1 hypothetical protein [Vibrio sp. Vb2610]MDW1805944.1 hypothetical protein [Vibrio sp. Vb2628]HCZ9035126.1 hypothetical protein [Vibrio alginolyticus]HCZ9053793.1 hypothetical protein [Vibrio alginolyticus]
MSVPFGLKDGRIVHVDEVSNGKNCGAQCPCCGRPLIAKNQGLLVSHHFSHEGGSECNGYTPMTYLHRYAQSVIQNEMKVVLPPIHYELTLHNVITETYILTNTRGVTFDRVHNEEEFKHYRVDCLGYKGDQSIAIEIKVTHANSLEKTLAFRKAGQIAIEIDLSYLHNDDRLYDAKQIRQAIYNPEYISWLVEPPLAQRRQWADKDFKQKVREHQAIVEQDKLRQQEYEKAEQRQIESFIYTMREDLAGALQWLNTVVSPSWIDQWEQAKKYPANNSLTNDYIGYFETILDIPIEGDWIFTTPRKHWQALVLYYLDHNDKSKLSNVKKFVIRHARIHPMMNNLNNSRFNGKDIARRAKLNVDWNSYWFLSAEEESKLIDPYFVIRSYIQKLIALDLVAFIPFFNVYRVYEGRLSKALASKGQCK